MIHDNRWDSWIVLLDRDDFIVRARMMVAAPFDREMQICTAGQAWHTFGLSQGDDLSTFMERLHDVWRA